MSLQSPGPGIADNGRDGDGVTREIADLAPWFHNLHLPSGTSTAPDHPLGDFPNYKWDQIAPFVPTDLRGCRALDIGCNAGFYSLELAKRGAEVLAIDHDEHYLTQARWARAKMRLDDRIELRLMDVYDLVHLKETFDLVLFLGVLYHLRYPLLGLDLVAERTAGTLIVQTLTVPGDERSSIPADLPFDQRDRLREPGWPAMAFIEHHFAGDHTNWWVPSASALEAMVRTTGLGIIGRPDHEIWVCQRCRPTHHQRELDRATGRLPEP